MVYDFQMLKNDEQYLEDRGCLIIRTVCKYMKTDVVFPLLAEIIGVVIDDLIYVQKCEDKRFASLFIQMMNVILLTADETSHFCKQLRSCFSTKTPNVEGQALFDKLYLFVN